MSSQHVRCSVPRRPNSARTKHALSQVVRTTEDVTYQEIRKLALTSNNGLTAAHLRERLNAIADIIRLRDGAYDLAPLRRWGDEHN